MVDQLTFKQIEGFPAPSYRVRLNAEDIGRLSLQAGDAAWQWSIDLGPDSQESAGTAASLADAQAQMSRALWASNLPEKGPERA